MEILCQDTTKIVVYLRILYKERLHALESAVEGVGDGRNEAWSARRSGSRERAVPEELHLNLSRAVPRTDTRRKRTKICTKAASEVHGWTSWSRIDAATRK